jgi:ABC-type uncharacterized transport system permease subunit
MKAARFVLGVLLWLLALGLTSLIVSSGLARGMMARSPWLLDNTPISD